jgi:hypothetical protein
MHLESCEYLSGPGNTRETSNPHWQVDKINRDATTFVRTLISSPSNRLGETNRSLYRLSSAFPLSSDLLQSTDLRLIRRRRCNSTSKRRPNGRQKYVPGAKLEFRNSGLFSLFPSGQIVSQRSYATKRNEAKGFGKTRLLKRLVNVVASCSFHILPSATQYEVLFAVNHIRLHAGMGKLC